MRAFDFAANQPWVIREENLRLILDIAQRDHTADFEAVAARQAKTSDQGGVLEMRGSTAIVNVSGPIFRYSNIFTDISGASSIETLAIAFEKARANSQVQSILLNIDSPGGEVSGVAEFAAQIYAARGDKKIVAYGGDLMASGAYWIAAAASEIVLAETAMAGSIGVVMAMVDRSMQDAARGVKTFQFVSSQSPKKRVDPATDEGRSVLQTTTDDLADEFISAIAKYRGVAAETIISDFGQGGVLIARKAIAAGMADRLGSFEGVLATLESALPTYSFGGSAVNNPNTKGVLMSTQTAEPTISATPPVDVAAIRAEAVNGERARVKAILTCEEAAGRASQAQTLALESDLSLDLVKKILTSLPKAETKTNDFAAHMANVKNPEVGQDETSGADSDAVSIKSTLALHNNGKGK